MSMTTTDAPAREATPETDPRAAEPSLSAEETPEAKPRLRGVVHASMVLLTVAGGVALMILSRGWPQWSASLVYMLAALQLFGFSAVYHLGNWKGRPGKVMRQIDHANIFVFIAGTYTPVAVGLLHGASMIVLLSLIWAVALAGVLLGVFALRAPRWVAAGLYVAMGWIAVGWLPSLWHIAGPAVPLLLIAGGLIYTLGAVVYAKKWPNPAPAWYGFHEVFHTLTVIAAICQWVALALAVR